MAKNKKTNFVKFKNKKEPVKVKSFFDREFLALKKEVENDIIKNLNKGEIRFCPLIKK